MDLEDAPLVVDEAALAATLGVPVQTEHARGQLCIFRFRQLVLHGEGLARHGYLDLTARRFRSTLWAGPHRCIDHLEVSALVALTCDPDGGRLTLSSRAVHLVLTRQGTLSAVPLAQERARLRRPESRDDAP